MSERCASCGTEVRVVSMTAAGTTSRCDCGQTSITRMAYGEVLYSASWVASSGGITVEPGPHLQAVPDPDPEPEPPAA